MNTHTRVEKVLDALPCLCRRYLRVSMRYRKSWGVALIRERAKRTLRVVQRYWDIMLLGQLPPNDAAVPEVPFGARGLHLPSAQPPPPSQRSWNWDALLTE